MFRALQPARWKEEHLLELGKSMVGEPALEDKKLGERDDEENPGIPAGYTYLGQFIDHDLTFDPVSSLDRQNDPDALVDFRTPRFDLDSLYGRGHADQPYLYDSVIPGHFRFPANGDLPRTDGGVALIGDPRNDENRIVSQLHVLFLRFHNAVLRKLEHRGASTEHLFATAQREVRWHYQWIVVHDFLRRLCGADTLSDVLHAEAYVSAGQSFNVSRAHLKFFKWRKDPFIPIEFAGAVYRFGHSMVRPSYHLNRAQQAATEALRSVHKRASWRVPFFAAIGDNLNGFSPMPDPNPFPLRIEWAFFFDLGAKNKPQPSYKIDTSLGDPLAQLFAANVVQPDPTHARRGLLSVRNLLRGQAFGLPSGQDVARAMGIPPLTAAELDLKSREVRTRLDDPRPGDPPPSQGDADATRPMAKEAQEAFAESTPLWFYILREAELRKEGKQLGPVGARLVAEVFAGLLAGDPHSYLSVEPNWSPRLGIFARDHFDMPELIRIAAPDSTGL